MKLYIQHYPPHMVAGKIQALQSKLTNKISFTELLSPEGYFILENSDIYRLDPVDKEISHHKIEGKIIMADSSYVKREKVFSQIPFDHCCIKKEHVYYSSQSNLKSKHFLTLVIEWTCTKEGNIPTDIFFLTDESIDNILLQKELNVFLSILN